MVFEAVLVKKLYSDVTVIKYFNSELRISPWHEKMLVSQGIIIKYLSGGGGRIDVYTKKHGRTTRAAWDRMLYQDP